MLITDLCDGAEAGKTKLPNRKKINKEQSAIWAGSTYAKFNIDGADITEPKDTDDKIVLGYNNQGLPFQIVVDGFFRCSKADVFQFVNKAITPLMDAYGANLSNPLNDPETVTKELIQQIAKKRPTSKGVEFTLSIAMTYERDNKLQCSGFGIGDTGIAVKRKNGQVEQLVANSEVDNFKDAFDNGTRISTEAVISRNTVFTTDIETGDELVGYTYVQDELEQIEDVSAQHNVSVRKKTLEVAQIQEGSLFNFLIAENDRIQIEKSNLSPEDKLSKAKESVPYQEGWGLKWGDDTTIGQIIVPDPQLRQQLIIEQLPENQLIRSLIDELELYITTRKDNARNSGCQYYSFFGRLTGMSAQVKIDAAEKLITALEYQINPIGNKPPTFTNDDIVALRNDSLGKILDGYKTALPDSLIDAERERSHNLMKRTW